MSASTEKMWWDLYPGSMGACALAVELFGAENVDPNTWGLPVSFQATKEDAEIAYVLYFKEYNLNYRPAAHRDP